MSECMNKPIIDLQGIFETRYGRSATTAQRVESCDVEWKRCFSGVLDRKDPVCETQHLVMDEPSPT